MCYFSAKKKYGKIISHSTKKNEKKLTFCLKSDMRNLVNYNLGSGKSKNLLFIELLLYKLCNFEAKNYKGVVS